MSFLNTQYLGFVGDKKWCPCFDTGVFISGKQRLLSQVGLEIFLPQNFTKYGDTCLYLGEENNKFSPGPNFLH